MSDALSKPTTRKNMKSSFLKEYLYVQAFLKEPIKVVFPWGEELLSPPKNLHISDLVFQRTYSCMDYFPCRKCCIGLWSLFLTEFTLPEVLEKVKPLSEIQNINVNGKNLEYLCVNHKGDYCPLSDLEKGCTVHIGNPITCMFPLVHFRQYRKDNINILIGHFGRNWRMGCPVQFRPYDNVEEFNDRVLSRFLRMKDYLDLIIQPITNNGTGNGSGVISGFPFTVGFGTTGIARIGGTTGYTVSLTASSGTSGNSWDYSNNYPWGTNATGTYTITYQV